MRTQKKVGVVFRVTAGRTEGTILWIVSMNLVAGWKKGMNKFEVEVQAAGVA